MGEPRNVVVIMSDQHNPKLAGFAGHPLVRTPNMDRLAARGTTFRRAYTPCPICVPARASFATGHWVHDIGYWDNAIAYDGRVKGWGHALQAAGIDVVSIGKLHYRAAEDPTGFDEQILPMHIADGIGQVWGMVRDPLPQREGGERMARAAGAGFSKYNKYDLAIAEKAEQWLEARARSKKPFVLYIGLVAPHFPYIVPEKWFDIYAHAELPRAVAHPDDGFKPHPWVERFMGVSPGIDKNTDEERRRCTAAYYGLVSFLDDNIGRVLNVLERTGLAGETTVVYTSDHGDMVGKRGQWGKSQAYEDTAGIPMIVAGPGIPEGKRSQTTVGLVDLSQGILDAAGLPALEGRPGRSLVSLAREPDSPDRIGFSEYHAYGAISAWYMVRRGRMKYVEYVGFEPELFDLEADPDEIVNLAADPAHAPTRAALAAELRRILDPETVDAEAKGDQRRMIERFGGIDAALRMGTPSATPTPFG